MVEIVSTPPPLAGAGAHRVRLHDGVLIEVRPIQPDDGERVRRMHARLSPPTIMLRYFHAVPYLPDTAITAFTHVNYFDQMALVVTMPAPGLISVAAHEIVGMATYERSSADAAEVAFLVEDAWQGRGIASILLYDLAAHARAIGLRHFHAITLARNTRMLDLLTQCGFPCTLRGGGGDEVAAWLDITALPQCRFARFVR
jgi:RimJ/RimL family protein N-acetyltransferase